MNLANFISSSNLTTYQNWYGHYAGNNTYEAWNPSSNYSALTLEIRTGDDSVLSAITFNVTGDLQSAYEQMELEEAAATSAEGYSTQLLATSIDPWTEPTMAVDEPNRLNKRACGSFCGVNLHCLLAPCFKCAAYRPGTWRKRCATGWGRAG
ncbi:uncharacterized protein TDEL_0G03370 [Torulaspora delbrueckii]|uniref:Uncharacterized protein n=1 Tax=Torulaspora delbrueckii TaxID=4950 RepID=G8ZXT7_TORDE|nr:hypothetical protein TDEL_0G03370 [Torulaspora delbrueckii]CCE93704.1 hypothetical protein TDEL_0G03370 [Torulaspora delbrueckii]